MWEKTNFQKIYIFVYTLLDTRLNFWPFIGKVSTRLSKLPSVCPSEHFEGTKKVLKTKWRRNNILSLFEHWTKNFRHFNENISTGLSKLHPTSPFETIWGRTFFFEKSYLFDNLFRKLEEKFSELQQNIFGKLPPLLCKYPRKHFKEGQFYWEKKNIFKTFGHWAFFCFSSKTFSRLLKLLLTCPWEKPEKGKNWMYNFC